MKKMVVITGDGIYKGASRYDYEVRGMVPLATFPFSVPTEEQWKSDPSSVMSALNCARESLSLAEPSLAHTLIAVLRRWYEVTVVTEGIDDLHENAGSKDVVHVFGEITKARFEGSFCEKDGFREDEDNIVCIGYDPLFIVPGDGREGQLRPHVQFRGEPTPLVEKAKAKVKEADVLIIVGTDASDPLVRNLLSEFPLEREVYVIPGKREETEEDGGKHQSTEGDEGDLGTVVLGGSADDGMHHLMEILGFDLTVLSLYEEFFLGGTEEAPVNEGRCDDDDPDSFDQEDEDDLLVLRINRTYVLDNEGKLLYRKNCAEKTFFWYDPSGKTIKEEILDDDSSQIVDYRYEGQHAVAKKIRTVSSGEPAFENVIPFKWSEGGKVVEFTEYHLTRTFCLNDDGLIVRKNEGDESGPWFSSFFERDGNGIIRTVRDFHVDGERGNLIEEEFAFFSPEGRRLYGENFSDPSRSFKCEYVDDGKGNWTECKVVMNDGKAKHRLWRRIYYGKSFPGRGINPREDIFGRITLNGWG
ncbi:MAG: hypothetical protein IJ202_06485 [Bacteroidales bacterium]|nr:hypothetical protein [Bacteroidales bacterium]